MSTIENKPFDKNKKIAKTIFRGAPNLTTAPDLNRQIESLTYQLENLEKKTGFVTDFKATATFSEGILTLVPQYTYMEYLGIAFAPAKTTLELTASIGNTLYIILKADKSTVTYSNDAGRKISGAYFVDNTSKAAADHVIYENEVMQVIKSTTSLPSNTLGIISAYTIISDGVTTRVIETVNGVTRGQSTILKNKGVFTHQTGAPKKITSGQTIDEALSVIANRIDNEDPQSEVIPVTISPSAEHTFATPFNGNIHHKNGRFFIETPAVTLSPDQYAEYALVYIVEVPWGFYFSDLRVPPNRFIGGTFVGRFNPSQAFSYFGYGIGPSTPLTLFHSTKKISGTGFITPTLISRTVRGSEYGDDYLALAITLPSVQVEGYTPTGDKSPAFTNFTALQGGIIGIPSAFHEVYLK